MSQQQVVQKEQAKKGSTFMQGCLGCFGLLVIGFIAVLVVGFFISNEKGTDTTTATTSSNSGLVNAGENAVISAKAEALSAISKDKMDELTNYASANNEDAIKRMIDKGEIISIPNGTAVTIVKRNGGSAEIDITDGVYKGMRLFTYIEMVKAP